MSEIDVGCIDLIHDDHAAEIAIVGRLHHPQGHRLDAGLRIDDDRGGLHGRQDRNGAPQEIRIPGGVDQIDVLVVRIEAGDGGVQRVDQLLFHRIEVADRGSLGHTAGGRDHSGRGEQRFDQRGLAGSGVTDQGKVADVLGIVIRHR